MVGETPCETVMLDGTRCPGTVLHGQRTDSPSDSYVYALPCSRCDVSILMRLAFVPMDPETRARTGMQQEMLARLETKPRKTEHNADAIRILRSVMKKPEDSRSVAMLGPVGTGKTFLALHTMTALIRLSRLRCLYLPEHSLLQAWRITHSDNKQLAGWGERVLSLARTVDWLVLDDLGQTRNASDGAIDAIESLVMHRYDNAAPVIVTSNLQPTGIAEHRGARVWSRLQGMAGNNVVEIRGADWRG
jgi:DNA replication protein DnaC